MRTSAGKQPFFGGAGGEPGAGGILSPLGLVLSRLDRLVDWERRDRRDLRLELEPMHDLVARLDHPERSFRAVHVAGTKGKGSVASLVGEGLLRAGFRVGIYASPHVERLVERVRLDGAPIDEAALAPALAAALDARDAAVAEGTPAVAATWFDVLTAGAFVAFREAGVEWAVVECGLGGRLDSTNVLGAPFCVLTNVDLEHTAILGPTRAAIAREKAGIVAPGAVVVSGVGREADEAGGVVLEVARQRGARVVHVDPDPAETLEQANARLAGALLDELGATVAGPSAVPAARLLDADARRAARLPGRLERRRLGGLPVVLDGAHVASSLARVLDELATDPTLPGAPCLVLALGRDKPLGAILKVLRSRVDRVICTSSGTGLSLPAEELRAAVGRAGIPTEGADGPEAALEKASAAAAPGGWILVTGSLHLVGRLRSRLAEDPEARACSPSSPICSSPTPS